MWKNLSITQKNELIRLFLSEGITDLSEMKSLYDNGLYSAKEGSNKYAYGSSLLTDHDPNNPYHVHNNGEKIVITPEQYEKHKDEPYFANIRKQVEEHQAAYPKPEYTETPNPEYRRVYENVKAASNQHINEHKFNNQIYKGYTPVPYPYMRNSVDGVVTDKEGNLYRLMTVADAGKGVTPMFTTTERNRAHGHEYDMQWVRVKTPAKTIRTLKQPLPVDKTYNVDEELDNAEEGLNFTENYKQYYPKGSTFAAGGNLYTDGGDKDKIQKAVQDKNTYAKYNIAKPSWDEEGTLYEMQLPPVSITADSPKTEANKKVLLNKGYTKEDLNNPNIKAHLPALANMLHNYDINGINYLKNIGTVGLGLAGILTGGSGIGLAGALGREGIKQGAKTLGKKALRFGVDAGIGAATDYTSNKAIQGLSNGEYEGFGDLMNRGVFNGSKDDVWKPILWDMVNPLGIATGIGTDVFLSPKILNNTFNRYTIAPTQNSTFNKDEIQRAFARATYEANNATNLPIEDNTKLQDEIASFFIPRMHISLDGDNKAYSEIMRKKMFVPIKKYDIAKFNQDVGFDLGVGGWYNRKHKHIIDLNLDKYSKVHEYSHSFDDNVLEGSNYMMPAYVKRSIGDYHDELRNFAKNKYTYNMYDDEFRIGEFDADTRASRLRLFDSLGLDPTKMSLKEQNFIIDNMSPQWFFNELKDRSGYGNKLYNQLKDEDKSKLLDLSKLGMRILPAVGAGAIITNTNTSK